MKLVHSNMERQLMWTEQQECEWIIESPILFSSYVRELREQIEGKEGKFVLSKNEDILDISKSVDIITDPLNFNINDKKILSKIYADLSVAAYEEDTYLKTQEVLGNLKSYFLELEQKNLIMLDLDDEIDMQALFKTLGVHISEAEDDFFENLNTYLKVSSILLKRKLIVFINVRSYISDEQLNEILNNAIYNEIRILFIENMQRSCPDRIKQYIIDNTGCEI